MSLWVDAARAPQDNRLHYERLSIVFFSLLNSLYILCAIIVWAFCMFIHWIYRRGKKQMREIANALKWC